LETTSHHFLVEVYKVKSELLDSLEELQSIFLESVKYGGATYISHHFHRFSPQGVSGVVVIAESHLSIHSWPENGYAAIDVFTCGDKRIGENILQYITEKLETSEYQIKYILRGN
jgi:S-adenosylmethionine decarboxylase proenzyme